MCVVYISSFAHRISQNISASDVSWAEGGGGKIFSSTSHYLGVSDLPLRRTFQPKAPAPARRKRCAATTLGGKACGHGGSAPFCEETGWNDNRRWTSVLQARTLQACSICETARATARACLVHGAERGETKRWWESHYATAWHWKRRKHCAFAVPWYRQRRVMAWNAGGRTRSVLRGSLRETKVKLLRESRNMKRPVGVVCSLYSGPLIAVEEEEAERRRRGYEREGSLEEEGVCLPTGLPVWAVSWEEEEEGSVSLWALSLATAAVLWAAVFHACRLMPHDLLWRRKKILLPYFLQWRSSQRHGLFLSLVCTMKCVCENLLSSERTCIWEYGRVLVPAWSAALPLPVTDEN